MSSKLKTMNLADVSNEFNPNVIVQRKIREGLKQIGARAMKEEDFRALCEVGAAQLATQASNFKDYVIGVRESGRTKRIWCGDVKFAAKAREALIK